MIYAFMIYWIRPTQNLNVRPMSCQNRENFRVVSQTTGATWTKAETENTTETKIRTNKTN